MPPLGPTERLYVRLRSYTTMLTAHAHMELGTAILWSIADAVSRIVRQGRSALPSMWWAYGQRAGPRRRDVRTSGG
jgi:hypothetical protein